MKKTSQKLILKIASEKALKQNVKALKYYNTYKEIADLLDRTNIAIGKKPAFKAATGSTLNFEINQYGVASTTT